MTKERPILFSGAMVRAILDGRKTQTRRVVKPQPTSGLDGWDWSWPVPGKNVTPGTRDYWRDDAKNTISPRYCPYGKPGDRLWVRETWAFGRNAIGSVRDEEGPFAYAADGEWGLRDRLCDRWRPSIHMPRYACRLMLEVTGVRVERLNDCSESDAIAEGVERSIVTDSAGEYWKGYMNGERSCRDTALESYQSLWNSINGAGAWDANPWVWVVEFRPDLSQIIQKR